MERNKPLRNIFFLPSCFLNTSRYYSFLLHVSYLLFFFLVTTAYSYANSETVRQQEKEKVGRKIQMQEMNVIRLQKDIQEEKQHIEKSAASEKSLLKKLEIMELKLQKQQKKLTNLRQQMAEQKVLISKKEKELQEVIAIKKAAQLHLQKRISAYYKLDKVSLVNITFSARTLPEILFFHDSFQVLITYDQELIKSYRKTIDELGRSREALTLEEGLLHEFISRADKERKAIAESKAELETLLTHIRTQKKLYEQAIVEFRKEEEKLSSTLITLKQKEELLDQEFRLNQGTLPMPVKGTITSFFGQQTTNNLGISKTSKGISISAPDGTPVKAIFKGTIFFSGYLRGYGNTVIVHHGYQYYSIISRVERLLKQKGDIVQQGNVIALMGDTAMLVEDGIQLEIRHGSEPMDPLSWIDQESVTIKKEPI